jgi:transposase
MAEVAYDIEQLFIEGLTEKNIAKTLDIPVEMVYDWLKSNGCWKEEDAVDERGVYIGLTW